MPSSDELKDKFLKALKSDMTMMIGLDGLEEGHARPLTAQFREGKDGGGTIWFFTAKDTDLVASLGCSTDRVSASFVSKGHDIFASLRGTISLDMNQQVIDELWNPQVAAWFKGGKTDPNLALLRLDAQRAEIWENAWSLVAGIKLLLGADPKEDYRDKVADVSLTPSK